MTRNCYLPYPLLLRPMEQSISMGDAAARFLASLPPAEREKKQQEVYRFARWFGYNRPFSEIKPPDVGRYGEQISTTVNDPAAALEPVRSFLAFARKAGISDINYGVHLRAKKPAQKSKKKSSSFLAKPAPEPVQMTAEGHATLQSELKKLEEERPRVVEEIQKAAADKDFRENAPLHAAKERQGYIEGRIRELEATLKLAQVVKEENGDRIGPGDQVVLTEIECNDELCITIVHATETNPGKGKISIASPIGKAVIGHREGDTIEVTAPAGVIRYKVAAVARKAG